MNRGTFEETALSLSTSTRREGREGMISREGDVKSPFRQENEAFGEFTPPEVEKAPGQPSFPPTLGNSPPQRWSIRNRGPHGRQVGDFAT